MRQYADHHIPESGAQLGHGGTHALADPDGLWYTQCIYFHSVAHCRRICDAFETLVQTLVGDCKCPLILTLKSS